MKEEELFNLQIDQKLIYNNESIITFKGFDKNFNVIIRDKNNNEKTIFKNIFLRYAKIHNILEGST